MISKVLLLSAYDAKSHKLWRQRLVQMFPQIDWTQLVLPPRNFNWRIRGNSLQWALNNRQELQADFDLILATSMVDLSSLRGFIPHLASIPTVLYFHENQFAYPDNRQQKDNVEPLLVPIYSALCADKIVFNSEYNRSSFLEGARNLFKKLPDDLPVSALEKIQSGNIIPVPVAADRSAIGRRQVSKYLEVVWNHRWEYDKGPELLLALVESISGTQLPIRLHIIGEKFRQVPQAFTDIEKLLKQHSLGMKMEAGKFGYIEDEASYYDLLANSDVVLSTALHDFQGLSVQEACLVGCTPLTPDRLVYPEYLVSDFLYQYSDNISVTAQSIVGRLRQWLTLKQEGKELPKADLQEYSMENLRGRYSKLFGEFN